MPKSPMPPPTANPRAQDEIRARDVRAVFGRTPAAGILPRSPVWSKDGRYIAYLRDIYGENGQKRTELWMYDTETRIDNPVYSKRLVSSFSWCKGDRIIAAAGGDLFSVTPDGSTIRLTDTKADEKSPKASPNCERIAFVRDGDLFVLDRLTNKEVRISEGGSPTRRFAETAWLYEEEFDTQDPMGWSDDNMRLWFYDTDLSNVPFREIPKLSGISEPMPYPRPGETNPLVRIATADFSTTSPTVSYLDTGSDSDHYFPRVAWHPDGRRLLVTRLDRLQTELEFLLCPADGASCTVPWSEKDPRFINLQPDPVFLPGGKSMLFLSESSGFAHIYQVGQDGNGLRPVTQGDWTVTELHGLTEDGKDVLFTANVADPLEYKLYRIPLDGGDIESTDAPQGCHSVRFSPTGKQYMDTHSALNRPPKIDIRTQDGEWVGTLAAQDAGRFNPGETVNDLFPIQTKNGPMNALLTRPIALSESTQYPVLVLVYGGPHVQLARNWFHTTYQPLRDLLARRGILVFTLDGRGSAGRGHDFDASVRLGLTRLELEDQLAGVEYLKTLPFVDKKRIGVFGWSFGGTMALSGLLRTDTFSMGVAVAPVTDWRLYDSAYTERYMQRPADNPEGYDGTALVPLADRLKAPLLLVHGISDDNVHFVHSARLFDALIRKGKPFDSLFFPGKDHKIAGPAARVHLFNTIVRFIEENL